MVEQTDIVQQMTNLIQLQGLDAQIYRLNAEKDDKPDEIRHLKDSLVHMQSELKDAEANLKSLQLKRKEKEIDLEGEENAVKKLQVQLYQLKSNKEYAIMLHEIESHKADNSLLEEEIIKLMDLIDVAESKAVEEKREFEEESRKVDAEVAKIEARVKEIDATLAEIEKKREKIAPSVNPRILKDYEKILAGKDGLALVEVVNDACGGCYMHLPPQVINQIRMKEHIICCESCQRMLYIKDEPT